MFRSHVSSLKLGPIFALYCASNFSYCQDGTEVSIPAQLSLSAATEIMLRANPLLLRERQNLPTAESRVVSASKRPNPEIEANSERFAALFNAFTTQDTREPDESDYTFWRNTKKCNRASIVSLSIGQDARR